MACSSANQGLYIAKPGHMAMVFSPFGWLYPLYPFFLLTQFAGSDNEKTPDYTIMKYRLMET